LAKLCQETSEKCTQFLPVALLRIRNAPRAQLYLSSFEMLYGRPLFSNLVIDPETDSLLKNRMDQGTFPQVIQKLGNKVLLVPTKGRKFQIEPGE
jgi:hypothetical protein